MGYVTRTAALTAALVAVWAAPAQGGEVIVVDGAHAERVSDPAVPAS